jgi:hypothetical protein
LCREGFVDSFVSQEYAGKIEMAFKRQVCGFLAALGTDDNV